MTDLRSGCPINLTLETLGDRWSLIVIRDVMFGNRRHFRVLLNESEEGIASNILADRLKRLVAAGLLSKAEDPTHKQLIPYVVVRDGGGRVLFKDSIAFGATHTLEVSPPVRIQSSDGSLEVTVDGQEHGAMGETGQSAQDVFTAR